MRIPFVFKFGFLEGAYVRAILESESLHVSANVRFLVDTGAIRTTISDRDAIRLGIDYAALEKVEQGMLGVGGTVDTYTLGDARLILNQSNKEKHTELIECLCVLKHSEINKEFCGYPAFLAGIS
ncbi:MAG: retroviral-like aspartic protease family protein [Candidatus Bathyarchaeota archaeon]|nr:retroviral-like aspartic protease family protein [Candidatus Bathyarchaeota archaeon]